MFPLREVAAPSFRGGITRCPDWGGGGGIVFWGLPYLEDALLWEGGEGSSPHGVMGSRGNKRNMYKGTGLSVKEATCISEQ